MCVRTIQWNVVNNYNRLIRLLHHHKELIAHEHAIVVITYFALLLCSGAMFSF